VTKPSSGSSSRSAVIVSFDDEYAARFIAELEPVCPIVHVSPLMRTVQATIESLRPSVVVFDIQTIKTEAQSILEIMETIGFAHPGIRKIALGYEDDPAQLMAAMKAGACDFLDRSASPQVIREVIVTQLHHGDYAHGTRKGRVIALVGSRDGEGTADIAANLAAHISESSEAGDVLLLDLNLDNSHYEIDFDVEITYSVREAVDELLRLDEALLTELLPQHRCGLSILPLATKNRQDEAISPQELATLLSVLRSFFSIIVVNAGCLRHKSCQPYLIPLCDQLVIVCSQRIGSVKTASTLIQPEILPADAQTTLGLVVSHYDPDITLTPDQISKRLGLPFLGAIPQARTILSNCHNVGTPLVLHSRHSRFARAVRELAEKLVPELPGARSSPLREYGARLLAAALNRRKAVA